MGALNIERKKSSIRPMPEKDRRGHSCPGMATTTTTDPSSSAHRPKGGRPKCEREHRRTLRRADTAPSDARRPSHSQKIPPTDDGRRRVSWVPTQPPASSKRSGLPNKISPEPARKLPEGGGSRANKAPKPKASGRCRTPEPPPTAGVLALVESPVWRKRGTSADSYLPDLDVGDVAKQQDMIKLENCNQIDSLKVLDFAFIRRSDGEFTYAMIADVRDDAVVFVVDSEGSTKEVSRKRWANCIRLVNPERPKVRGRPEGRNTSSLRKAMSMYSTAQTVVSGQTVLSLFSFDSK